MEYLDWQDANENWQGANIGWHAANFGTFLDPDQYNIRYAYVASAQST